MASSVKETDDGAAATTKRPKGFGYRHLQVLLLFFGLSMAYSLRVNLSIAIVAMVDRPGNSTNQKPNEDALQFYDWNEKMQGYILSSFFWGYLMSQITAGRLAQVFGAKILLSTASVICGILTLLTPLAASYDWKLLLVVRVLQGIFQGCFFPCFHTLLSKWTHPSERGFLSTFAYSGMHIGTFVMLAGSGLLISTSIGWPLIFYVSGGFAILWSLIWNIYGSSTPADCKVISAEEKLFIESMAGSTNNRYLEVPWSKILRSTPVLALVIVHATQCWGFYVLLTETPTYLKQIFGFDIKTNAILSAFPYLVTWVLCMFVSRISDYLINHEHLSVTASRKLYNSIGHWVPMLALIILPFTYNAPITVFLLTCAVALNAFTTVGYLINHMDLSPNFAGSLMGFTNSLANTLSILGPITVGNILNGAQSIHEKEERWKIVFLLTAGFYFVGNFVFVLFGQAKIQPWNECEEETKKDEK